MTQYAKTAEVRRGILDACLSTFGEAGFHGASMAEIARRAGISHTGLLHHFPHKETLLTAVLELQDERGAEYLQAHAALSPDADPLDVLRGMIQTLIERNQRVGLVELGAVLTGEATAAAHPAHDHFAGRYRNVRSFVTRLFERLREEGRVTSTIPPARLAALMIAATDGLRTQWLFDREAIDVETCVAELIATFVPELAD